MRIRAEFASGWVLCFVEKALANAVFLELVLKGSHADTE